MAWEQRGPCWDGVRCMHAGRAIAGHVTSVASLLVLHNTLNNTGRHTSMNSPFMTSSVSLPTL